MVGFVNLDKINNHLSRFEELLSEEDDNVSITQLAKSMMVFMVKGIFTALKFPYDLFPCNSLVGEQLFSPFWETVYRLERMGFKVHVYMCFLSFECNELDRKYAPIT